MFDLLGHKARADELQRDIYTLQEEIADIRSCRNAAIDAHRIEVTRLRANCRDAIRALKAANKAIDEFVVAADDQLLNEFWFRPDEESSK